MPDYDLNALGTYSDCSELGSVSFTNNGDEELTITIQNCCSFDFSEDILINDLAVGVYDYIISNGNCLINGSFEIEDLDADSDCGNLDFVDGFDSWDLSSNTDIADDDSNFQDVLNQPCDGDHFSIIRSGEVSNGSAVFGDPITSPSGTGDILVLSTEHNGATNQSFLTGGQSHKISKCFDVDDGNSCLSFNFAMIFNDPINDGEHRHQPGFSFKVFEEDGTPIRSQSINSGDFNDLDLDACDGCINDLNWTPKCIDLEDHVGEKVCIEFEVKGCVVKGGIFQPDRPGTHGVTAFIEGLCNNCEDNKPTCELVVDPFICDGEIEFDFMTNNFQIVGLSLTELGGTPEFEFSFQNQLPNVSIDQLADNNNISLICGETYELHLNLQNECDGCDNKFEFEYNDISCSDNFEIDYPTAYLICDEETNSVWINVQQQNCQGCSYSWVPNENLLGSNLHSPLVLPNPSYDQAFNQTYEVTVQNLIGCTKSEEVIFSTGFTEELVVNENFCYIDISFSLSASFPISLDDFNVGLEQNWGIQNMLSMEEFQVDANTVNYSFCYDKCVLADISNIDLQINYSFQPSDPSDVIVIGNCDNSVEVGSFCISCYSKPWYVFIQNIFSPTLGPTPLDQVFNIDLTSSLADDCQDNFKSSVYRVEIDIFDRWGTLVFSSDLTAEDSCGEGLSGLEPQLVWDGMFGDDFVEAGALAYVVKIHSCSKEYVPSCVSCSGETTTCNDPATEVQIISGDVTIIF